VSQHADEKIWVVVEKKDDGHFVATAYDRETDANNYYIEMQARYHEFGDRVQIQETVLNRRDRDIPFDDAPWGALRLDIKSEFVEGLMEDMVPLDQIKPGAAERFVCEKIDMVRRRTLKRIDKILRDETKEELLVDDDWREYPADMED
jgi:hypothetical protein